MNRLCQSVLCVVMFVLMASSVSASVVPEFTFDCIMQSGTPIPGSSFRVFDEFSEPTPMRGSPDTVIFLGADQYGSMPSYDAYTIANGTITPLDYNVTVYYGEGKYETYGIYDASCPSSDHGVAAFAAQSEKTVVPQLFLSQGGSTTCVFANASRTYHGIFDQWYRNNTIVFRAYSGSNEQTHGVYAYDVNSQLLATIAANGTPLPDGTVSGKVNDVCYDGNQIAIKANYGIYSTDVNGNWRTVANSTMQIPGTSRNFLNFMDIVLDDGYTYFIGDDNNQDYNTGGIFREKNGVIEWLYEWDRVYEEMRTVDDLYDLNVCDGNLAFIKKYETKTLYTIIDGVTTPVIQVGDMLDGKTVSDFDMGGEAFGEGILAFSVTFNDNSHAIYTASFAVPEPSMIMLLSLAMLSMGVVALRKRN